ncbi:MAG: alpha/beta fold hydrolase [Alphaproteobacteria bacterium]|nr:alpha/beta fold hydrolase [Alphaproteobacteria bacterium]
MKQFIKNSNNVDLCVQIFEPSTNTDKAKLAIVCHGITGYKEQDVILQTAQTLTYCGYSVITFDTRNSRGESFNNHTCATLSSMYGDLQSVINWAKTQKFYNEPFLLAGHSLGGSVILKYAEKYPQSVTHLILISSIFDGKEFLKNTQESTPEFFNQLKNGGIIRTRDKVDCYLDDSYLHDFMKHDLYSNSHNLNMPVLIISGDSDIVSRVNNNERFYQNLKCKKEICILQNCSHIYEEESNKLDLHNTIKNFLIP